MDYGRFKYEQAKKQQEAKKKQVIVHLKEVKVSPKTDPHDLETKIRSIRRFLERKDKVKVSVFSGAERFLYRKRARRCLKG